MKDNKVPVKSEKRRFFRLTQGDIFEGNVQVTPIGADYPESTPEDLTALLSRFVRNGIATSKVETGRQHKL